MRLRVRAETRGLPALLVIPAKGGITCTWISAINLVRTKPTKDTKMVTESDREEAMFGSVTDQTMRASE
jgi:hypothetical protein